MGRTRNKNQKASTPTKNQKENKPAEIVDSSVANEVETPVDETQAVETPTVTEETPEVVEDTPEMTDDQAPVETEEKVEKPSSSRVFWVEGYGNVNAKSQAEAEKKAKKIIEDRLK